MRCLGLSPTVPIPAGETFEKHIVKHIVKQSIQCNTYAFICMNMSTAYSLYARECVGWGGRISKTKQPWVNSVVRSA